MGEKFGTRFGVKISERAELPFLTPPKPPQRGVDPPRGRNHVNFRPYAPTQTTQIIFLARALVKGILGSSDFCSKRLLKTLQDREHDDVFFTESTSPSESVMGRSVHIEIASKGPRPTSSTASSSTAAAAVAPTAATDAKSLGRYSMLS